MVVRRVCRFCSVVRSKPMIKQVSDGEGDLKFILVCSDVAR